MTLLALKDVSLRFGGLTALKEVSFNLNRGEILSIIGPNGVGGFQRRGALRALERSRHCDHQRVCEWLAVQ